MEIKILIVGIIILGVLTFGLMSAGIINEIIKPEKPIEKVKYEYTPSTKETCIGNKCSLEIYSGVRFAQENNGWKKVEDVTSLKESNIQCLVVKDNKLDPDVECLDWNMTSITLDIKDKTKEYPIKIYDKNNRLSPKIEFEPKQLDIEKIDYSFGDEIHIGEKSTVIILNESGIGNLGDVRLESNNPSNNYGNQDSIGVLNSTLREKYFTSLIGFNLSSIPENVFINSANVTLTVEGSGLDPEESSDLSLRKVDRDYYWEETSVTWNTRPTEGEYSSASSYLTVTNLDGPGDKLTFDVDAEVKDAISFGDNNISLYLIAENSQGDVGILDRVNFDSKESSTLDERPVMNIEYTKFLEINEPLDNQNIYNNLSFILNTSNYETNSSIIYSFDEGNSNTTLCTNSLECQDVITAPSQGWYNLSVWGNTTNNFWYNDTIQNLLFANQTTYNFSDEFDGTNMFFYDYRNDTKTYPFNNHNPPYGIFQSDETLNTNLDELDGINYTSNIASSDHYHLINSTITNFNASSILFVNLTWWGSAQRAQPTQNIGGWIWNYSNSEWQSCISLFSQFSNLPKSCVVDNIDDNILNENTFTFIIWSNTSVGSSTDFNTDYVIFQYIYFEEESAPSEVNICPSYGGSGNYELNCSDNCWIPDDTVIDGDLILMALNGDGTIKLNSSLIFQGSNRKIVQSNGCSFSKTPGSLIS
jgi:hypothetical protein